MGILLQTVEQVDTVAGFTFFILPAVKDWVLLLAAAMLADYITGIVAAFIGKSLSFQCGWQGALKKAVTFAIVCVAVILDRILLFSGEKIGLFNNSEGWVTIVVVVWLLLGEMLSVLENLGGIGIPMPANLKKLLGSLQKKANGKISSDTQDENQKR